MQEGGKGTAVVTLGNPKKQVIEEKRRLKGREEQINDDLTP